MSPRPDVAGRRLRARGALLLLLLAAAPVPHASAWQDAAGGAGAAASSTPASDASDGEQARALVLDTADKVSGLLKEPGLTSAERRERIVSLVDTRIDMETVTKLVLAKNFKRFTPEQQAEFRRQFRQHLIATYYRNAESIKFKHIDITESREEERGDWTVKSKVVTEEQGDNLVDYRLRKDKSGAWKIIDITIERVSLVANFRSQFQEILSDKDPAALIQLLAEKNAKADVEAAAEDKAADEKVAAEKAKKGGNGDAAAGASDGSAAGGGESRPPNGGAPEGSAGGGS